MFKKFTDKVKTKLHIGNKNECTETKHTAKVDRICSKRKCSRSLCQNCSYEKTNSDDYDLYCYECVQIVTKEAALGSLQMMESTETDADGMFAFEGSRDEGSGPVQVDGDFKKFGVQIDKKTGEIKGMADFLRSASEVSVKRKINSGDTQSSSAAAAATLQGSTEDVKAVAERDTFVNAGKKFSLSTKPSYIVCEDQPRLEERIVSVLNQATLEVFEV